MARQITEEEIESLQWLWSAQDKTYLVENDNLINEGLQYAVYDSKGTMIVFEDNDLYQYVVQKMKDTGVLIISRGMRYKQELEAIRTSAIAKYQSLWTTERAKP